MTHNELLDLEGLGEEEPHETGVFTNIIPDISLLPTGDFVNRLWYYVLFHRARAMGYGPEHLSLLQMTEYATKKKIDNAAHAKLFNHRTITNIVSVIKVYYEWISNQVLAGSPYDEQTMVDYLMDRYRSTHMSRKTGRNLETNLRTYIVFPNGRAASGVGPAPPRMKFPKHEYWTRELNKYEVKSFPMEDNMVLLQRLALQISDGLDTPRAKSREVQQQLLIRLLLGLGAGFRPSEANQLTYRDIITLFQGKTVYIYSAKSSRPTRDQVNMLCPFLMEDNVYNHETLVRVDNGLKANQAFGDFVVDIVKSMCVKLVQPAVSDFYRGPGAHRHLDLDDVKPLYKANLTSERDAFRRLLIATESIRSNLSTRELTGVNYNMAVSERSQYRGCLFRLMRKAFAFVLAVLYKKQNLMDRPVALKKHLRHSNMKNIHVYLQAAQLPGDTWEWIKRYKFEDWTPYIRTEARAVSRQGM
jgi:hypothetical protein